MPLTFTIQDMERNSEGWTRWVDKQLTLDELMEYFDYSEYDTDLTVQMIKVIRAQQEEIERLKRLIVFS